MAGEPILPLTGWTAPSLAWVIIVIFLAIMAVGRQQGVVSSLMGTILSTGLGFAGVAEAYTNDGGKNVLKGYRSAIHLGVGMAGLAVVLALVFVRIPKDIRQGWDENDASAPQ